MHGVSNVEEAKTGENVPDKEETEIFLNQNHQPQKGDKILFFSKQRDSWQVITLTSGAIKRFLKSGWYYNFLYQDMEEDGTYLHPGQPYWGFLTLFPTAYRFPLCYRGGEIHPPS